MKRWLTLTAAVVLFVAAASWALPAVAAEPPNRQTGKNPVPLVVPIAGDWDGDGFTDLGWFNTDRLDFFLVDVPPFEDDSEAHVGGFGCFRPFVPAGRHDLLPLAGDWSGGDGVSEPALFDPANREYFFYRRAPLSGEWELADRFVHPRPGQGGLPIAGDWDGNGVDEVGLYLEDERIFLLLAANDPNAPMTEVVLEGLPDGDWLPVAGDWGDAAGFGVAAVWNAVLRELHIALGNDSGRPVLAGEDYSAEAPGLLPFSGIHHHRLLRPGDARRPRAVRALPVRLRRELQPGRTTPHPAAAAGGSRGRRLPGPDALSARPRASLALPTPWASCPWRGQRR